MVGEGRAGADRCVVWMVAELCVLAIGCVDVPAFYYASSFNGDLSSWDTSSVTTLVQSTSPPVFALVRFQS